MRHYVKEWRERRGMTQEQLADRIGLAHKGSIQKIEKHFDRDLPQRRVTKFETIFQINPGDLFRSPEELTHDSPSSDKLSSTGNGQTSLGGQNMIGELSAWMEEAADLPPDLIPAARKLLRTLKNAAGSEHRQSNPQSRVKGK